MNHSHSDHHIGEQTFGRSCAALRQQMQLTQRELARLLVVSEQDVERWERGLHVPTPEQLKQLLVLALQRHTFPAERAREEIEQLWVGAGLQAGFENFWRLAQQTAAFAPPALLVLKQGAVQMSASSSPQEPASNPSRVDWGEALDVHVLYGREQELALLTQWVVQERCQVVTVLGMGGIGKSASAVTLMRQIAPAFQAVVFRSVRDAPACQDLLADCLQVLSPQPLASLPPSVDQLIDLLLECLQTQRCLLVLDNLETLLQEQDAAGHMRSGSEDYAMLLRRVAQTPHQSCLLLTSREAPAVLEQLESSLTRMRALRLGGLEVEACEPLLDERELVGTEQERESLVQRYVGNPLALKIIAEAIAELFGGEISSFLKQDVVILRSLRDLLAEQWTRLSALEQALLTWLTIVREPIEVVDLQALLVVPVAEGQVRDALQALHRRSLVEQGKQPGTFTLQSVVLEYVTVVLVERVREQIQQGVWEDLISYGFEQAGAKDYVRQRQERLIVAPILLCLRTHFQQADTLEQRLLGLLDQLRTWDQQTQGYGPANLIALLRLLRGHLRGLDLSQLALRHASLQGVEMQDAKLCEARLYDTTLTEAMPAIWSVAISCTGTFWAAGSERGEVRVWRESGQRLHLAWQAHTDNTFTLAFSPDERTLASGSWDGTVKLWDLHSGALLWTNWHTDLVFSVVFSPDGQTLASGGNDATIRLWEASSGKQSQTLASLGGAVNVQAWSPDGQRLAAGCQDGSIRLWLVRPDSATDSRALLGHRHWVHGLAFAPDGTRLVSGSWDGTVKLWDVVSGCELQTLTGHTQKVYDVAWSPDGATVASASADQRIWLWDVTQNRYRAVLQGHRATVYRLAFTPDSLHLLSGSEDRTLRLWEVSNGQCVRLLQGYASCVYDLDWSPDSTHLVSGNSNGQVLLWEATGTVPLKVLGIHEWVVFGVAWSPDGHWLASSGWDNAIRVWDPKAGRCLHLLRDPDHAGTLFYRVAWSPDGHLLASGTYQQGIHVWEVTSHRLQVVERTAPMQLRQLAWSPDGTRLASGSTDGRVCLWDLASGTFHQQLSEHHGVIMSVAWSPDGHLLASASGGSHGGELVVCEVKSGTCLQAFAGLPTLVSAVTWDQSGDRLVSGGNDGKLCWWEVKSGTCLRVCQAHEGSIWSLKRSPDGRWLASSGDDGAIRIWDLHRGELMRTLRHDRPYERVNITGLRGVTEAQKTTLRALGAYDEAERPRK